MMPMTPRPIAETKDISLNSRPLGFLSRVQTLPICEINDLMLIAMIQLRKRGF